MAGQSAERFVSQGFVGVRIVKAQAASPTLLANRTACLAPERASTITSARAFLKGDLVRSVAKSAGLSRKQANHAVDSVFEAISEALQQGSNVKLVGFGTFSVAKRKATGRRVSGEAVGVETSAGPSFEAGKTLRQSVK